MNRNAPQRAILCAALGLALALAACDEESSPLRVVPVAPAASRVVAGATQVGTVAAPAPDSLAVLVTDRFGNPVPDVAVEFTVTGGAGSIRPALARTAADGVALAEWTLGTQAGANTAAARAAGLDAHGFSALGQPGPAANVARIAGDEQTQMVGTPLGAALVAEVTDAYGNAIQGLELTWSVALGGGSVDPGSTVTDAAGRAQAAWTLGTQAGEQRVHVIAGDGPLAIFRATATPAAPVNAFASAGDAQAGPPGMRLREPLVVKVTDAYDNAVGGVAVEWRVEGGGGSVDPAAGVTDGAGEASTWLTVGAGPGGNRVVAEAEGLPPVTFHAETLDPFNLSVAGAYLVQSTQTFGGDVPLVAGRDAYLRIFVLGSYADAPRPDVRVDFYDGGTPLASHTLDGSSQSVPTAVDEASLGASWNLFVPGEMIAPGLSMLVTVDPDDEIPELDDGDNAYPPSGTPLALDVRVLPAFRARLVPVRIAALNATGDVTEANKASYLVDAEKMFPVPGSDVDVHAVFTSSAGGIATGTQWNTIIGEIRAMRVAEGSSRYYYGVLPLVGNPAYGGLGYIGYPAAIGVESFPDIAAHEWGHNFGRRHSPCGNPGGPDPNYPYPNASIGVYGFDPARLELKHPASYRDLMSYCGPEWISDYTYGHVLAFREDEAGGQAAFAAAREPALVVWGRAEGDSLVLEPGFEVVTRPALPAEAGPYRVQGLDAAGAVLFELPFAGERLGHGPADARHFAFAIPATLAQPQRLARLRLTAPGMPAAERARPAAAQARTPPALEAAGAGQVRLRWDAGALPLAVARDPRTGEVLAFARGGAAALRTDAPELELILSDGTGSTRRLVAVRR